MARRWSMPADPYRSEVEALTARCASLEAELEKTRRRLNERKPRGRWLPGWVLVVAGLVTLATVCATAGTILEFANSAAAALVERNPGHPGIRHYRRIAVP
jgi:hypothetical protein